ETEETSETASDGAELRTVSPWPTEYIHACWDPASVNSTYSATGLPMTIPDNNPTGIASHLNIVSGYGDDPNFTVTVNITHTYIRDLVINLTHNNYTWSIWNRAGGSADNIHQTFSLVAPQAMFAQENWLQGDWTLSVSDNAWVDVGTLDSW